MREITSHKVNGLNDALTIRVQDEASADEPNQRYIISTPSKPLRQELAHPCVQCEIDFQRGPIAEVGVNGVSIEALLAVVVDRLQHFQAGEFKCRENALALTKLEEAMHWLHHRTRERTQRGVEGTLQK